MTLAEAFEVLGLPEDADAKAIKRAYHKLLKRFKPDRDPQGFRRLRDAFEVASALASPVEIDEGPRAATDPARHAAATVDPGLVHDAIDRGKVPWAHALVMDHRWAHAMLDDADGELRWATRRVGLATVLEHRPAFDQLAAAYPDVFRPDDPALSYLLAISRDWQRLDAGARLPREVRSFITQLAASDGAPRLALARGLARWFWNDIATAELFLIHLWNEYRDLGPFLMTEVRSFDDDLEAASGRVPLPAQPPPRKLVRRTGAWVQRAIATPFVILTASSLPAPPSLQLAAALVLAGLVWLLTRNPSEEELEQQHDRLLRSCLFHDVPPAEVAAALPWDRAQRERLESNILLEACYRIGRLARLGLDDPSETRPRPRKRPRA